ncbi:hypothetical protein LIER_37723 [Lithospermum erythrorhizon]|uniref:Uncharacterized protein n=1 Tax=Lithospermum erythrorhizon TaxID=34254 RepID=A0AAV3PQU5_LITER
MANLGLGPQASYESSRLLPLLLVPWEMATLPCLNRPWTCMRNWPGNALGGSPGTGVKGSPPPVQQLSLGHGPTGSGP